MRYIEPAIYELLKNFVSGRVSAMIASQRAEMPFIVYQQIDSSRWKTITGTTGMAQASIQVDVYSPRYHEMKAIAAQVEQLLDGYDDTVYYSLDGTEDQVRVGISLQNAEDMGDSEGDPFLYRNSAVYLVTYNQKD